MRDGKIFENNQAAIIGEVVSELFFDHEFRGEGFYTMEVSVKRLSESCDIFPIMISERLIDADKDYRGKIVRVEGQLRSYDRHEETKTRHVLSVFAREVAFLEEEPANTKTNQIYLDGFVCKTPIYRITPLGREICDVFLAVNRPYKKTDYIPCICRGRNALFSSRFEVGDRITIYGRIQSREYRKQISEDNFETRIAYEVSVQEMKTDGFNNRLGGRD